MTTRSEALAYVDKFDYLAISNAISLVNAIFDHVESLEAQMVEHSQIAHRTLLIGEDEGWFEWKGDAESGGWHSSLHNDLIKIRDNQHIYSWVRLHDGVMDALKKENEQLKAELEALQAKPPCCQFNDRNIDDCDGCDWVDECIYHKYHEPKET